ncbi:MAG: helix-turn-helix domain-containing protein [Caldilineaceae bacterium]|nr:helix-turn-helix domain-containing protein [Caldilineaceae bacterium]
MTWRAVLEILNAEAGPDLAAKIEARILRDLGGARISVPATSRPVLTAGTIQTALRENGYSVAKAAAQLGVHPRTLYRHLQPTKAQPAPVRLVR